MQLVAAIALWVVVAVRSWGVDNDRWKPGILPSMWAVALAATLNEDNIYLVLDGLLGGRNWMNFIVHILMGYGLVRLFELMVEASEGSGLARRGLFILGGVLYGIQASVFVFAAPVPSTAHFAEAARQAPAWAIYQAAFFVWVAIVAFYAFILLIQRDRRQERSAFRVGLGIFAGACVSAIGMAVTKILQLLADPDSSVGSLAGLAYKCFMVITIGGFAAGFLITAVAKAKRKAQDGGWMLEALADANEMLYRLKTSGITPKTPPLPKGGAGNHRIDLYRALSQIEDYRIVNPAFFAEDEEARLASYSTRLTHALASP